MREQYTQRVVFKGSIARQLLREGYHLVDIKPDRIDSNKSVFIFEITDGFEDRMYELIDEYNEKRAAKLASLD